MLVSGNTLLIHTYEFKLNYIKMILGIPTISVIALLAVTIYISMDAVKVLYNPPKKDDVEVIYLYGFSCANMIVGMVIYHSFRRC